MTTLAAHTRRNRDLVIRFTNLIEQARQRQVSREDWNAAADEMALLSWSWNMTALPNATQALAYARTVCTEDWADPVEYADHIMWRVDAVRRQAHDEVHGNGRCVVFA